MQSREPAAVTVMRAGVKREEEERMIFVDVCYEVKFSVYCRLTAGRVIS